MLSGTIKVSGGVCSSNQDREREGEKSQQRGTGTWKWTGLRAPSWSEPASSRAGGKAR